MSDVKWTKEQQQVIDTRNCNLLVAAAAGSGKTAVLVERIIKMIMDDKNPVDIDKLLVVTFTNAASSEMRERIAEALSKEIGKGRNPVRLQRQLTLLNKASITTIHSFCLNIIKNNFHKLDIDPGFRVADETEVILLKGEAIDEVFEDNYDNNEEFLKLVETYCNNRNDDKLVNLVLSIHRFSISSPNPILWLNESAEQFNVNSLDDINNCKFVKVLRETLKINLAGIYDQYMEALKIVKEIDELSPYEELLEDEGAMVNDLLLSLKGDFSKFVQEISNLSFNKLPTLRKIENKSDKERVQKLRNDLKKELEKLKADYESLTIDNLKEGYKKVYPIIKALCELVIEFDNKYKQKKKDRGIIDFNDFEHFAIDILVEKDEEGNWIKDENGEYIPSSVALELREKYEEILIDEYQDSNFVQELILNMVSKVKEGRPNIFMVGDIKQSIYRFRQAKPELFLNKYINYSDLEGEPFRKILLFKNFRSRKEVLDVVNLIFESIMSEKIGELNYDEKEALNLGADYKKLDEDIVANVGGNIELHIFDKEDSEEEDNQDNQDNQEELGGEVTSNIAYEARIVARRINELIFNNEKPFLVLDKGTKEYRRVTYRDIVILLRSTSNWSQEFVNELKNYGIPSYADVNSGYFDTTEIKTILSLLQVIDNPRQDIPLLSIMRCPAIGGFSSEDFIEIKIDNNSKNFFDSCKIYIGMKDEEDLLCKKLKNFFNKLRLWREKSLYTPIDEFIWYLYTETGYYGFVGALQNGVQRQANLKVLFQRAQEYENTSYKGLFNFINFINKLKSNSGDMGSAKILGENEDVVRIMSIHKSKGLEFPVVFLCGIDKKFNLQDLNSNLLLHYELGFGPDLIDYERRISYALPVKKAIREKILLETLSEEMRILYVALTRAKEKLIMVGAAKDIPNFIEKMKNKAFVKNGKISEYSIYKCRSYLEWIVLSLLKDGKEDFEKYNVAFRAWSKVELEEIIEENDEDRGEILREILNNYISNEQKDEELYSFINKRLTYKSEYEASEKIPTVVTVSELKRRFNTLEVDTNDTNENLFFKSDLDISLKAKPSFMEGKKALSKSEKGTAFHSVMQYIDLNKVDSIESIKSDIFRMYSNELITEEESMSVDPNKIYSFFKDKIGIKMLSNYNSVRREIEFHIPLDANEILKNINNNAYNGQNILLQGIIDCYFENEEGDIILIDYKTDYVQKGDEGKIINRYKIQLEYYEKALEIITHKKVKEKYLYLFYLDKSVEVK